ncbi:MAG: GldG family protein [Planctomycetota bacterium]
MKLSPLHRKISLAAIPGGLVLMLASVIITDVAAQAFARVDFLFPVLLGLGGLLTAGGLALNFWRIVDVFRLRKTAAGMHLAGVVVLSTALAGTVCYIGTRRYTRIDMTWERRHTLHSKTTSLLESLEEPVQAILLYSSQNQDFRALWRRRVRSMLHDFQARSAASFAVTEYDTYEQWQEVRSRVLSQIDEDNPPDTCVILRQGEATQIVPFRQTIKPSRRRGGRPKLMAESALASALVKLTRKDKTLVCALTGHGERPVGAEEKSKVGSRSLSGPARLSLAAVAKRLKEDNVEIRTINLRAGGSIPDRCRTLIVPGPRVPLTPGEIEQIRTYLQQGNGTLLAMFDSSAATQSDASLGPLKKMLASYGIRVHTEAVGMVKRPGLASGGGGGTQGTSPLQTVPVKSDGYLDHPITADLSGYTMALTQTAPLTLEQNRAGEKMTVKPLLTGVSGSWGETSLDAKPAEASFDAEDDIKGPLVLAAVAQPKKGQGPRIVVTSSALSFTNTAVRQNPANLYFIQNAVNWLAGRRSLLGIPAESLGLNVTSLSPAQVRAARWIFIGLLPGAIIAAGIIVWRIRTKT